MKQELYYCDVCGKQIDAREPKFSLSFAIYPRFDEALCEKGVRVVTKVFRDFCAECEEEIGQMLFRKVKRLQEARHG